MDIDVQRGGARLSVFTPIPPYGGQGVWCASRGGSRPPEGGLSSPTPPRPPSWIHPDPPLLPYGRAGGLVRMQRGGQGPQRGVWVHRTPLDPPRGSTQTPPLGPIWEGRGLVRMQRGVKAPRGLQRPAQLTPTGRWPTFGMHRPCRCRCAPGNVAAFRSTSSRTRPLEWPRADSRRPLLRAAPKAGGDERFWDV